MRGKGSKRGNGTKLGEGEGTKLGEGERDLEGERAFWDYYVRDYHLKNATSSGRYRQYSFAGKYFGI